jgi:hypothetical protein
MPSSPPAVPLAAARAALRAAPARLYGVRGARRVAREALRCACPYGARDEEDCAAIALTGAGCCREEAGRGREEAGR